MTEWLNNNNRLFSIVAAPVYFPASCMVVFPFLHTLASIRCLWAFWWWSFWLVQGDNSLWFSFAFCLVVGSAEHLFMCLVGHPACFLWRNVSLGLSPIFWLGCLFLLLSCINCLYILEINPLWVSSFANIFSLSIGYLFVLVIVSFAVQKIMSLVGSHLFISAFISTALGYWLKKTLLWFLSEKVLPVFSSRSFMLSYHIFKPF